MKQIPCYYTGEAELSSTVVLGFMICEIYIHVTYKLYKLKFYLFLSICLYLCNLQYLLATFAQLKLLTNFAQMPLFISMLPRILLDMLKILERHGFKMESQTQSKMEFFLQKQLTAEKR